MRSVAARQSLGSDWTPVPIYHELHVAAVTYANLPIPVTMRPGDNELSRRRSAAVGTAGDWRRSVWPLLVSVPGNVVFVVVDVPTVPDH